ncbi:phospholipase C, phosphocholine-specific [Chitinophaga lutea]|uniref:phospholipase C n=1 Tax=Chitinophaga lutea TaxID=2488634 RepID=A0A3N4PN16_9BACT|nr:phospholipase C, phosphocholine-specific [Chitinophaga lutea]RPE08988.1 phospholipase C, phosphocholine-specific [Chitinophaga lutea]
MDTRREFLRKAALLTGAGGLANMLPETIQRALAINPAPGSTFLDAEHVVFLMQENRSFDHCFGRLKGVRGFNDPRALKLEDGRPVFMQKNKEGETYAPFRLNIKDTRATWMSALPHSWADQVDARNNGQYDRWLDVKKSGHREYSRMPLTMGYYDREDIPFYYALADAFTVCDQHFCSSLTGTTPNRLYFWTGTIRSEARPDVKANVYNSDVDYGKQAHWQTFPEILEANQVSWKIYQNEVSVDTGFEGEEDAWLANFTDNPIEWFSQYHVEYSEAHLAYLRRVKDELPAKLAAQEKELAALKAGTDEHKALEKKIQRQKEYLAYTHKTLDMVAKTPFSALPAREQQLHKKAFTTNIGDPDYHELTKLKYNDGNTEREVQLPKGDILHQFRHDVKNGQLPAVSWIVAPENFSDHPGAPWYGAWYLSEVMDILTQNPEVWKKTIFVLTYDENDGYFDHVAPFVPPVPGKAGTGKVSAGIDPAVEYVTLAAQAPGRGARESAIGLGYRVPLVVASPWSRGGYVNSQVFDHTSDLQFLEKWLSHKLKKNIATGNITAWRRTVCGDFSSIFRPYNGEKIDMPASVEKEAFIETVHKARFKAPPANFKNIAGEQVQSVREGQEKGLLPEQEPGIRPACAIPYELYADAALSKDRRQVVLQLAAGNALFGKQSAGAPFHVYTGHNQQSRGYAVKAGDRLTDEWDAQTGYSLEVYGPNGFYREFKGDAADPGLTVKLTYTRTGNKPDGSIAFELHNTSAQGLEIAVADMSYGGKPQKLNLAAGARKTVRVPLAASHGWYDQLISVRGKNNFMQRYAGHAENGAPSKSDPLMGKVVGEKG